jgi:hypothetical protein
MELHPGHSRNVIQSWIARGRLMLLPLLRSLPSCFGVKQHKFPIVDSSFHNAGKVLVNNQPVLKAGAPVSRTAQVTITVEEPRFVCRAGFKMEAALRHFAIDVTGLRALDSGLSTGGFTDCLLQHGAASVVGVDVGYGQVAEKVRTDPRVTVMERTNLRHFRADQLPGGGVVDLVTLDLSFISGALWFLHAGSLCFFYSFRFFFDSLLHNVPLTDSIPISCMPSALQC